MSANADPNRPLHWISPSESQSFRKVYHVLRFITTSIHELLGHGTGKLLAETSPGVYNFDSNNLPTNTLTGKPIQSWYKPGQTWTSVFEKLAGTVEECRAMLISYYLAESKDMLHMYGYDDNTEITADERKLTIGMCSFLKNLTWCDQFSTTCIRTSGFKDYALCRLSMKKISPGVVPIQM